MTKQNLTAIVLTAAIAIEGQHYDDGDILIVDADVELETAKQLVRLGRAEPSDAKRGRRKADAKPAKADEPPPAA